MWALNVAKNEERCAVRFETASTACKPYPCRMRASLTRVPAVSVRQ